MARPINANALETKDKLCSVACELFAQQGPDGTSVRQIADAAGVNSALVSHYFGGKEGLYEACIDSMYLELGALRSVLMTSFAKGGAPSLLLKRAVSEGFSFGRNHRSALQLIMRDILDRGHLPSKRSDSALVPFLEEVPKLLAPYSSKAPQELRLSLQSLVFLVVRYSLSSDRELGILTGQKKLYLSRVTSHLHECALALLGLKEKEA